MLERLLPFNDAWERDVAYSDGYRLPVFLIAIAIGVVALACAWFPYERWQIDAALEMWEFPY